MKHFYKPRVCGLLLTLILFAGSTQTALALGTASGVTISNSATVDYQVGGIGQTPILSSPLGDTPTGIDTDFLVDNKVDVVVATTDGTWVAVTPGLSDQALTFAVRNDGNTPQDFILSAALTAVDPFGGVENFDTTGLRVFVESGGGAGYQAGLDTVTFIDELAADATATVYVVSDIPVALINGDIAAYTLTANAANAGGAGLGAETLATVGLDTAGVDVVLADGLTAYDAQYAGDHSADSAYQVETATLAVTKTSEVDWDPFNLSTNPKAIPGARILYTIIVENTGVATAGSVVISDLVTLPTVYFSESITLGGAGKSDAAADDEAEFSGGSVIVDVGSLAAGAIAEITFLVTIQ